MARPKQMEKATHLGVMIDEDLLEEFKHHARKSRMNVSEVIRELVDKWVKKQRSKIL